MQFPSDIDADSLYKFSTSFTAGSWEEILQDALNTIEKGGVNETRYSASTFNFTEEDQRGVALLQWSKVHEETLADLSRGGCQCHIF